jgi:hypothetical protein
LIQPHPSNYEVHQRPLIAVLPVTHSAAVSRDEIIPALRGPPSA